MLHTFVWFAVKESLSNRASTHASLLYTHSIEQVYRRMLQLKIGMFKPTLMLCAYGSGSPFIHLYPFFTIVLYYFMGKESFPIFRLSCTRRGREKGKKLDNLFFSRLYQIFQVFSSILRGSSVKNLQLAPFLLCTYFLWLYKQFLSCWLFSIISGKKSE